MPSDETVLDSLQGLPQPRGQHYHFAHVALADAVRSDPEGILAALAGGGGADFLDEVWRGVKAKFPSSEDRVDERGLAGSVENLPCGKSCAVVIMPRAERLGEAHMIAAVVVPGERRFGLFKKPATLRYFTLEVSFGKDQVDSPALCEWKFAKGGGKSHVKCGADLKVDRAGFLAAVDEQVSDQVSIGPDGE